MQRTLSLRTAIIGAIVSALLIGGVIYALNQFAVDRSTGLFTVDVDEAANLDVEFFTMTPGGGSTVGADWCEGNLTAGGLNCVAKVSNLATALPVDVQLAVTSAAAGAGDLASNLTLGIYRIADAGAGVRDDCRGGNLVGWTEILAPAALSSLPASTPYLAPASGQPGAAQHVCFVLAYTGGAYGPTPGAISTSAALRVTGTAQ